MKLCIHVRPRDDGRGWAIDVYDESVKRITIDWEDREGNPQRTVVDNRKDTLTHYANLQIWKGDDAQQARPATQKARKPAADLPPDDEGGAA